MLGGGEPASQAGVQAEPDKIEHHKRAEAQHTRSCLRQNKYPVDLSGLCLLNHSANFSHYGPCGPHSSFTREAPARPGLARRTPDSGSRNVPLTTVWLSAAALQKGECSQGQIPPTVSQGI